MHQLLCIVAIIETVHNGSSLRGGDIVIDLQIGHPAIINNANTPEAMLGVTPPLEDDFAIKSYFATGGIEEYFATRIAEDCNGKEVVGEAGKAVGLAGVWRFYGLGGLLRGLFSFFHHLVG
jgi:hypothetical protein